MQASLGVGTEAATGTLVPAKTEAIAHKSFKLHIFRAHAGAPFKGTATFQK